MNEHIESLILQIKDEILQALEPDKPSHDVSFGTTFPSTTEAMLLAEDVPVKNTAKIVASPQNSGTIYLASEQVDVLNPYTRFNGLGASDVLELSIANLNLIWVACSFAGDSVSWAVEL